MPPMATPTGGQTDAETQDAAEAVTVTAPATARENPPRTATVPPAPPRTADGPVSDEDIIRSTEQFLAMFRRIGDRGGSLRIGAGVDIELPAVVVEGRRANPVQIAAEAGSSRPRLRFRPSPMAGGSSTEWTGLFGVRSGALRLRGLDLVVTQPENLPADRLAAITVAPGAELSLIDCTITISVRRSTIAALAVHRPPAPTPAPAGRDRSGSDAIAPAVVEVRESFVRSGGDAVTVASGCRLELKLEDDMIATEGSLLHAWGGVRGALEDAGQRPSLDVRINRVAARVQGGLVHLQTTPEEPNMDSVDIDAEDSILSTVSGDNPLFRLEGQDQLEQLRDRVRWVGHNVAYHRIKTYRRDEIVQAGGLPRIYDRDDWTRAFLPTDDSPMLADLKFRHQAEATTPAWELERDDLRLAPGSKERALGPNADKVPDPPSDDGF